MKKIFKKIISSLIVQIRACAQLYTLWLTERQFDHTIVLKFGIMCPNHTEIPFYIFIYALYCLLTPMYMHRTSHGLISTTSNCTSVWNGCTKILKRSQTVQYNQDSTYQKVPSTKIWENDINSMYCCKNDPIQMYWMTPIFCQVQSQHAQLHTKKLSVETRSIQLYTSFFQKILH